MLTGISAPTAWPFFQPNLAPSPRTPLGIRTGCWTAAGVGPDTLTIAGVNLAAGDLLLCGTESRDAVSFPDVQVDCNGTFLTQDRYTVAADVLVCMFSLFMGAPVVGGTITAEWPVWGPPPAIALIACKVSGLTGVCRETQENIEAPTANPFTGFTGAYGGPSFHWGLVGTSGFPADAPGAWQNGMSAGQRASINGGLGLLDSADLKEGFRSVLATAARTQILGQTVRASNSIIGYYG